MSFAKSLIRVAFGIALGFALLPGAKATTLYYDFSVTATSGPLNGDMASGTFSFDSSSITPGSTNTTAGLLTSLSFTWDSVAYTEATANTGWLVFDGSGNLTDATFGNDCIAGTCSVNAGVEQWYVGDGSFTYTLASDSSTFWSGTYSFSQIPEPSTVALTSAGALALFALRRRRRKV